MASGNITFSLIIPVYGVEKYISKCAETLLGQTYPYIQFIFVNDGTKDKSIEVLKALIDSRFPNVKERVVIVDKQNEGLPAARKTGLSYATGDYILHVDSDDWLELDAVERIAECAARTDADMIYFSLVKEFGDRTRKTGDRTYSADTKLKFIKDIFNYKAHGYCWNKCTKRSVYLDNCIYIPKYGMHEDIFLMSQVIWYSKSIVHMKDAFLYHYRRDNPGSISVSATRNRRRDSAMNMMDLYSRYRDNIADSPLQTSYSEILFRTAWLSMRYGFGFFEKYDYLADDLKKIRPSLSNKTFFLWQLIVKLKVSFMG